MDRSLLVLTPTSLLSFTSKIMIVRRGGGVGRRRGEDGREERGGEDGREERKRKEKR